MSTWVFFSVEGIGIDLLEFVDFGLLLLSLFGLKFDLHTKSLSITSLIPSQMNRQFTPINVVDGVSQLY